MESDKYLTEQIIGVDSRKEKKLVAEVSRSFQKSSKI